MLAQEVLRLARCVVTNAKPYRMSDISHSAKGPTLRQRPYTDRAISSNLSLDILADKIDLVYFGLSLTALSPAAARYFIFIVYRFLAPQGEKKIHKQLKMTGKRKS
jgi:hypothetical protein